MEWLPHHKIFYKIEAPMAIWGQGKSAIAQKSQCVFGTLLIDIFLFGNRMYKFETYTIEPRRYSISSSSNRSLFVLSFSLSLGTWLSITINSLLESMVLACTDSRRYSTFWVIAVGQSFASYPVSLPSAPFLFLVASIPL